MTYSRVRTPIDLDGFGEPARKTGRGVVLRVVALFVLLGLPFAEAWLLAFVAGQIGLWPTVGLVITTSVLGLLLLVIQGRRSWGSLVDALRAGRMPSRELADTTLVFIGGIVLLLPGLLTDVLGLALLLPFTRVMIRRLLGGVLNRQVNRHQQDSGIIPGEAEPAPSPDDDDVIIGRLMP